MEIKSKTKDEITSLRMNLYSLLDLDSNNKDNILKASEELDRAILSYIKSNRGK